MDGFEKRNKTNGAKDTIKQNIDSNANSNQYNPIDENAVTNRVLENIVRDLIALVKGNEFLTRLGILFASELNKESGSFSKSDKIPSFNGSSYSVEAVSLKEASISSNQNNLSYPVLQKLSNKQDVGSDLVNSSSVVGRSGENQNAPVTYQNSITIASSKIGPNENKFESTSMSSLINNTTLTNNSTMQPDCIVAQSNGDSTSATNFVPFNVIMKSDADSRFSKSSSEAKILTNQNNLVLETSKTRPSEKIFENTSMSSLINNTTVTNNNTMQSQPCSSASESNFIPLDAVKGFIMKSDGGTGFSKSSSEATIFVNHNNLVLESSKIKPSERTFENTSMSSLINNKNSSNYNTTQPQSSNAENTIRVSTNATNAIPFDGNMMKIDASAGFPKSSSEATTFGNQNDVTHPVFQVLSNKPDVGSDSTTSSSDAGISGSDYIPVTYQNNIIQNAFTINAWKEKFVNGSVSSKINNTIQPNSSSPQNMTGIHVVNGNNAFSFDANRGLMIEFDAGLSLSKSNSEATILGHQNNISLEASTISTIEQAILRSNNPIELNETDVITVDGQTGVWANKTEVMNWKGPIPISEYKINKDPYPEIITKQSDKLLEYDQEIGIRYLRPPTPPTPGEIIIKIDKNTLPPPAPPLVIRQQPARPETPAPVVIREKPPKAPPAVGQKLITISGKHLPPPPIKVIVERLPELPPKPAPVIIERWLPYSNTKRKVILQKPASDDPIFAKPKNLIVQWTPPKVQIKKQFKNLGIIRANPIDYVQTYGNTLKTRVELPDFVKELKPANGVELNSGNNTPLPVELEGDIEALKFVDLDSEGLGEYKSMVNEITTRKQSSSAASNIVLKGIRINNQDLTMKEYFEFRSKESDEFVPKNEYDTVILALKESLARNDQINKLASLIGDINRAGDKIIYEEFKK